VFNCELTKNDDYRTQIFELLEDVLFIDGYDREGHPAPNEDDEDQDGESPSLLVCCVLPKSIPLITSTLVVRFQ